MAGGADAPQLALLAGVDDGNACASPGALLQPAICGGAPSSVVVGDFYHEPEDPLRGVVLGNSGIQSLASRDCAWLDCAEDFFGHVGFHELRELPWGGAASTSVLVPRSSAAAAEVANMVQGFLGKHASVNVLKVNPKKLSFRAVAWFQLLGSCDLKIRLFQLPDEDSYVLELVRRSGCALAFAEIFRQLAAFMIERLEGVRSVDEGRCPNVVEDVSLLVAPPEAALLLQEAYAPLMEVVASSAHPGCKVDAIAALALAAAGCAAAAACLGQVLKGGFLDALLRDPRMEVAATAEILAKELAVPTCDAMTPHGA